MAASALAKIPYLLPGLPGHPIPNEFVELHVHVDDGSRLKPPCIPPANIAKLHDTWIKFSIPQLVHWGTLHFQGMPIAKGATESAKQARMRRCWQEFVDYHPRPVKVNGRDRLVVDKHANPDTQKKFSEVLGEAMGVAIVGKALAAGYAAFTRRSFNTSTRHDYDINLTSGTVWLETRGRHGANGRFKAMMEVDRKFKRKHKIKKVQKKGKRTKLLVTTVGTGRFNQAIGALVYPSHQAIRNYPDVELMDPPGNPQQPTPVEQARRVLRHYWEIFERQNVKVLLEIERLLSLTDDELDTELTRGVSSFVDSNNLPPKRHAYFGRTSLWVLGERFLGTWFDRAVAPEWLRQVGIMNADEGIFFYGLWVGVIRRLGSYDMLDLLQSDAETTVTMTDSGTTFVLFNDGVLTAWSPTMAQLKADAGGTKKS